MMVLCGGRSVASPGALLVTWVLGCWWWEGGGGEIGCGSEGGKTGLGIGG